MRRPIYRRHQHESVGEQRFALGFQRKWKSSGMDTNKCRLLCSRWRSPDENARKRLAGLAREVSKPRIPGRVRIDNLARYLRGIQSKQSLMAKLKPITIERYLSTRMIAAMKLIALLACCFCELAFGQSNSAGSVQATGSCSSASANSDRFTITCGISKEQGEALLQIMNKILQSHLDPSAVMDKLGEISLGTQDNPKPAGGRIFTESQVSAMSQVLRRFPGKRVYIVLLSDNEANAYGKALIKIFTDSGWNVKLNQIRALAIPTYGVYATADPTLLASLTAAGVSIRGTGDIPTVPPQTAAILVGLKPY
jgi:hypothetical protein